VDRPLEVYPEALEHVRQMFARRKREMPQRNELQAMFPSGSRVVPNPHGTAPGIDLDIPRSGRNPCRFICLPGVPAELREMWEIYVNEALRAMGAGRRFIVRRNIKCFGAGESQVESRLPDLIRRDHIPRVGITASRATITLRITAEEATEAECHAQIDATVATIHKCLGSLVYGEGDDELQDAVVRLLRERGMSLATAEVATAGLLTQLLGSAVAADKRCFRGGLIAADEQTLAKILAVENNGVAALAEACRERFAANMGLAVGAFPMADSKSGESTLGTLQIALASAEGTRTIEFNFQLHPDIVLIYCAKRALDLVRHALL
jgi:nicotinamide-nucleotide amidase